MGLIVQDVKLTAFSAGHCGQNSVFSVTWIPGSLVNLSPVLQGVGGTAVLLGLPLFPLVFCSPDGCSRLVGL